MFENILATLYICVKRVLEVVVVVGLIAVVTVESVRMNVNKELKTKSHTWMLNGLRKDEH